MDNNKKLYEHRIGVQMQSASFSLIKISASWPLAKILVYKDRLVISIFKKEFVFPFALIEKIEKHTLRIQIHHHIPEINKSVFISGFITSTKIFEELKSVIRKNDISMNI